MPNIDRFGVLITEDCYRFRTSTPSQLVAACVRMHGDRIPGPLLDAITADAQRFGPHERRGLAVAAAYLILAGLRAREVGEAAGWSPKYVQNMASRGRHYLALRGHQDGDVEARIKVMVAAKKTEAKAEATARRKAQVSTLPPAGESPR